MPAEKEGFVSAPTDPATAPWDTSTWDDIEEELATVAPTVRVQWNAARAKIQLEKRRFRPSRSPWQRPSAPPGIPPPHRPPGKVNWAAYGKPRSLITLFDRPWSPPDPHRDEKAATPWNLKAPRLSPSVAAARFDLVAEEEEEQGDSRCSGGCGEPYPPDSVLKVEEPTEGAGGNTAAQTDAC